MYFACLHCVLAYNSCIGDLGISLSTQFVSTNDIITTKNALITTKNALITLYELQNAAGAFPYAGPPLNIVSVISDTYHAWTLIGTYSYVLYSGDFEWLQEVWSNYTRGVQYLVSLVDDTGLVNVQSDLDWGRNGMGGHNSEANALYYKASVFLFTALPNLTFLLGSDQQRRPGFLAERYRPCL